MTTKTVRIRSKEDLLAAIEKARVIFVQVRFGVSEDWIKIAKSEARFLANKVSAADFDSDGDIASYGAGQQLYLEGSHQ